MKCGEKKGTFAGFKRHLSAKEPLCDECRKARNLYNRKYDEKRRATRREYLNEQQRTRLRKRSSEKRKLDSYNLRGYQLKSKYGITREQWNDLLVKQNNNCAVCKREPDTRGWATDHDHSTGRVRGILCHKCNIRLGLLGDTLSEIQTNLERIIKYLGT